MIRSLLTLALAVSLSGSAFANPTSRYLRDAAAGPIVWQPWGQRAFDAAKKANRPLFVSIGFASSYECFRLHREVFADGEVAGTVNGYFVPVLVDRFEHPEVAEAFDTIQKALGASPTTPSNFIITPSFEPVAATGLIAPGEFRTWLANGTNRWTNERESLLDEARRNLIKAHTLGEKRAPLPFDLKTVDAVVADIARTHDPKVLQPMAISFALRYGERTENKAVRAAALEALRLFARTAMRDQIGGGFHRAPGVFEKILVDQALMAMVYLEAWQLTKEPEFERVARTTLDYVIRDLHRTKGAFDATQDAHGLVPGQGPQFVNGAFYLWSKDEVMHVLGREPGAKALRAYGIESMHGNLPVFVEPPEPAIAQKLLEYRQKRPEPFRDFNELAGWNGLMISALSRAGAAFGDRAYTDAAVVAARVLTTSLWDAKTKTLYRSDAATAKVVPALSEDYAMVIQGLIDVFDATTDVKWLDLAKTLQARQHELFWDASAGRYISGTSLPEQLKGLLVENDVHQPSVNSLAASNQLRLSALTANDRGRGIATTIFESFGGRLARSGAELPQLASALSMAFDAPKFDVVILAKRTETDALLRSIGERWEPMRFVIRVPGKGPARDAITRAFPFVAALTGEKDVPVAYLCEKGDCRRQ